MPEEKNMGNQGDQKEKAASGELSARLKKIREKREGEDKKKVLAAAAAAVAVVAAVAIAGGLLGERNQDGVMKVETAAASLETTAPLPQEPTQASIVLETTLSAEEQASKEYEETVQSVLDGYANLGIAEVSGYLNIRKTPESFGEVIGELPRGGACEVLDTSLEGWYKISSGGVTGYVSSQYVHTGEKAREMAAEDVKERAIIETNRLNVREEPDPDSEVVGQVMKDERYLVKGEEGGWSYPEWLRYFRGDGGRLVSDPLRKDYRLRKGGIYPDGPGGEGQGDGGGEADGVRQHGRRQCADRAKYGFNDLDADFQ